MVSQLLSTKQCDRREFVLAAGIVVASSLGACSGPLPTKEEEQQFAMNHQLAMPTTPISIRVRVARVRDPHSTLLLNGVTATKSPTSLKFATHTLQYGKHKRLITGEIHTHKREDISPSAHDVVAHIPLEHYLPGVLAGELYAHWHPDTFAAQAVAARSYAVVHHLNRKDTSHFDLNDDPSSQVFLGDITLEVAHKAVVDTKGIVLTWNDTVIPAYYCACCGGLAATATDAISNSPQHRIPPLQGQNSKDICTTLDVHKWNAQRSSRTFRLRLNEYASSMNIPNLESLRSIRAIEPSQFNTHGRPTAITIADRRKQEFEVSAKQFLRAANAPIHSLPTPKQTIWSSFLEGEKNKAKLQLKGVGLGHGVGLCQHGAQALAGKGTNWEDILFWYYPQSSLSTLKG